MNESSRRFNFNISSVLFEESEKIMAVLNERRPDQDKVS